MGKDVLEAFLGEGVDKEGPYTEEAEVLKYFPLLGTGTTAEQAQHQKPACSTRHIPAMAYGNLNRRTLSRPKPSPLRALAIFSRSPGPSSSNRPSGESGIITLAEEGAVPRNLLRTATHTSMGTERDPSLALIVRSTACEKHVRRPRYSAQALS